MTRPEWKTPLSVSRRSFRDPGGCLLEVEGRLIRAITSSGWADLNHFLAAPLAREFLEWGRLVRTSVLSDTEKDSLLQSRPLQSLLDGHDIAGLVEHEKIPFPSFPYEWPPEMLHEAGSLTLELSEKLLEKGFGLKDATPYNILFRGPGPVFVDVLSFEPRDVADPTWRPYAQFIRTFLLPLLLSRFFGFSVQSILTTHRDGIEPGEIYRLCGPLRRLRPLFLGLVSMPVWLSTNCLHKDIIYQKKSLADPDKASFVLRHLFKTLRKQLKAVAPTARPTSTWSEYMCGSNNYSEPAMKAKEAFVQAVIDDCQPATVLDVGCNRGDFSAIAARGGAVVVAIDADPVVVGQTWRKAHLDALDILPLVVDLTRPTPAIGWRNHECPAFLDRARGNFQCVMMLAVIHHMLISERIPLDDLLNLASELTTDSLVIEFVAPNDSMFQRLLRGRDHLFTWLTKEYFELVCQKYFHIVRSVRLPDMNRWMYLLRKAPKAAYG